MAAMLAAGAQLSSRGYDVAFTFGNTARIDLICTVPDGKPFKVQVKGLSDEWDFYVQKGFFEAADQSDLFMIVVLVPSVEPRGNASLPFRFFILSHAETKAEFSKYPTVKRDGTKYMEAGLAWTTVKSYEDHWNVLPSPCLAV